MFTKGIKTQAEKYRPISLLPLKSKVTEKSIPNQTQDYLQRNGLFYVHLWGFRANHYTDTCLSWLTDIILNGAESGKHIGMILIDLHKNFDTLDHTVLLDKMKCTGFSDKAIKSFYS